LYFSNLAIPPGYWGSWSWLKLSAEMKQNTTRNKRHLIIIRNLTIYKELGDKRRYRKDDFVMFKEELQQSNLPVLVDVLVWDKVPKVFQKGILKNYVVLFESSGP